MENSNALKSIRESAEQKKTEKALTALMRTREGFFKTDCNETKARADLFRRFPKARVIQVFPWGVSLETVPLKRVPTPPKGYAFKGGAARLALSQALGFETGYRQGRDLDLVRVGTVIDASDQAIAEKLMEEDARHGHGVELIENFKTYFSTRDITANEVLYCADRVTASFDAVYDLADGILEPTPYALSQSLDNRERISAKIVRFESERQLAGNPYTKIVLATTAPLTIPNFLLHFDRALQQSGRLANLFCKNASRQGILPIEFTGAQTVSDITTHCQQLPKKQLKRFPQVMLICQDNKKGSTLQKIRKFR